MTTRSSGVLHFLRALPIALVLAALCCGKTQEGPTDGETHFLKACAVGSDDCGADLVCLCGVCALPCSQTNECADLSGAARCVPVADRGGLCDAPAFCDVQCTSDAPCQNLRAGLRCVGGFCRPASDGVGGTGGTAAGGSGGDSPGGAAGSVAACTRGETAGDEVVMLGDVFLAQEQEIGPLIESLARGAGALGADETYRDYSSLTENSFLIAGVLLADRFAAAQAESPVRVVIMNGGGSDMLLGSCGAAPSPDCQLIADVVTGANTLFARMAASGVEDVVFFFYPDPQDDAELRAELNVLRPLLADACATAPVPCHWLDLRTTFDAHPEYLETDFVPTTAGAEATASAIWTVMEQACIAQ